MTLSTVARTALLAITVLVFPLSVNGQSTDSPVASIVDAAREHEKARRWDDAFHAWVRVLGIDRAHEEARRQLPICLRLAFQATRHRDPGLTARVFAMSQAEALALYEEVLTKLQANFVDTQKTSTNRLFRQGVEELLTALADGGFRDRYLKGVDELTIAKFRSNLQIAWSGRELTTPRQAAIVVAEIGAAARRTFNLRTNHPIVLEFICGACNSLDEHSAFLPSSLLIEAPVPVAPSVQARLLEPGIVSIRISQFQPSTPQEVSEALKKFAAMGQPVRSAIIDLRGNAGGSFIAGVRTAEYFLPGGIIVTAHGPHDDATKVYASATGTAASDVQLVVLVDADTASAAEVLAIALRDNRRAKLIGTATFGKGSIQNVIKFSTAEEVDPKTGNVTPRAGIRLTLARLTGPSGAPISAGVVPDEIIPDRERQDLTALENARELSRRFVPGMQVPSMMR